MAVGRLGKAAAETVTPEFAAAAEGGGSGLALLPCFTLALAIQQHEVSGKGSL